VNSWTASVGAGPGKLVASGIRPGVVRSELTPQ
jgi:hypothetical protein